MHPSDWVALITPVLAVVGAMTGFVVKLTQLIEAVKDLGETMKGAASTLADHEGRLKNLEHSSGPPAGWYGHGRAP